MTEISKFYAREEMLAHAKHPHNRGTILKAMIRRQGVNALCGDTVTIFATVKKEKITAIKFNGKGCFISQAAASLLTVALIGRSLKDTVGLKESEMFAILSGEITPARKKCALLPLQTLQEGIAEYLKSHVKKDAKKRRK